MIDSESENNNGNMLTFIMRFDDKLYNNEEAFKWLKKYN